VMRTLAAVLMLGGLGYIGSNALTESAEPEATPKEAHFSFPSPPILLRSPVSGQEWSAERRPAGDARLVSYDTLPLEECAWTPDSSGPALLAKMPLRQALMQAQVAQRAAGATSEPVDFSGRKPQRMIRDSYAAYSAVAVDAARDEVVLTDENLFNILVYDRQAKTTPNAPTEMKRIIGGLNTKVEFQCGLYIDPASGDIYAVNNDTIDTLVIFSRQAVGDVPPDRQLHTPHGTFGIAVDEDTQEMFLTVQHDSAISVFKKGAKGGEAPIRLVQGDRTKLQDPHGMALDTKNKLLYVTNHGSVHQVRASTPGQGKARRRENPSNWPLTREDVVPGSGQMLPPSITVYSENASGDVPPLRVIQGPKTQLDWPTGIAVDPEHDELFVANDGGNSLLVFSASANGDIAPIRVVKGPKSLISNPTGVYLDTKNHELWVASFGNHTAAAYNPTANGDIAPIRIIRSAPANRPVPGMGNPHPIAYDSKREEILVPN
jgi:DNA-binding beta-propeller fold protein YncE